MCTIMHIFAEETGRKSYTAANKMFFYLTLFFQGMLSFFTGVKLILHLLANFNKIVLFQQL